jgi:hypothetical protein
MTRRHGKFYYCLPLASYIPLPRIHKDLSSKGTDLVVGGGGGGGGGGNRDKQEGKMKDPEGIFTPDWGILIEYSSCVSTYFTL